MNGRSVACLGLIAMLCAACGGGGGGSGSPVVSGVSVSAPVKRQITLTASASDPASVTGYCFQTAPGKPAAGDACFSASASITIDVPASPVRYYVWAKDVAGNISAGFEYEAAGPCSSAGLTAANSVSLPTVCVLTSLGEYVLALESSKAPITSTNFLKYVNDGFYSQTVFHRVLSNFMVQGGGFTGVPISTANAKAGTAYPPIALEAPAVTGLSNTLGTIAMARTSQLNSATSQFFINVVDNPGLDTAGGGYAVFGRVISGMDTTIQSIRNVSVQSNGSEPSQPLSPPVILWAYQLK